MNDTKDMWMSSADALAAVQQVAATRAEALQLLQDALSGGAIHALGVPADAGRRMQDQKQYALEEEMLLSHFIPSDFWSESKVEHERGWSWTTGSFKSDSERFGDLSAYFDVKFSRVDVLCLCEEISGKSHNGVKGLAKSDQKTLGGRPLSKGWADWVAYMACAVGEGRLFGNMTATEARDIIATDMTIDGLEELSRSTTQNAVNRVLEMLREKGITSQ